MVVAEGGVRCYVLERRDGQWNVGSIAGGQGEMGASVFDAVYGILQHDRGGLLWVGLFFLLHSPSTCLFGL